MKKIPLNGIAIVLLLAGFGWSLTQVLTNSYNAGEFETDKENGVKIIRLAHWQLELGYRDAMDRLINKYNALPKVKAAKVRVIQMPVTEKVYGQWLNVHLMSGTAPDISEKGMAKLTGGSYVARYFEPLGDYTDVPNPYNAPQYLPEKMHPDLVKSLSTSPWRETFNDGMRGGWDDKLQNFYAVPTSFFGAIRLYYNKTLFRNAKDLIREGLKQNQLPDWFAKRVDDGFVPLNDAFKKWAENDLPPDTMGRLLLCCSAIRAYGQLIGQTKMVPIAGSSYSQKLFANAYKVPMTSPYAQKMELDHNSSISPLENFAAWEKKVWSFDDPRMKAYYECVLEACKQFPSGFLALGRDQAMNRFILGQAAMIATGAWDASSIMSGSSGHSKDEDNFDVGIMPFPLPAKDEKWGEFVTYPANEAQANAGAPYSISQRTSHMKWCLDFLQYMSSYTVNQEFNREAGWIPVVMGTSPTKQMRPFSPNPYGLSSGTGMNMTPLTTNIRTIYEGQLWLYMSGDITYDQFVKRMVQGLEDQQMGIRRLWYSEWESQRNTHRNKERMLATQKIRELFLNDKSAKDKYIRGVYSSSSFNNGNNIRDYWQRVHPDKPFPDEF